MSGPRLILDTDILSLLGRQRPPPGLSAWLAAVGIDRLLLCFPVIAELKRGAHLLVETNPQKASQIFAWIDEILKTEFEYAEMTAEVAEVYAEMTSFPKLRHMWTVDRYAKHNRLGHDLMIAAVSIAHNCPVLTANVRDYVAIDQHFPLPGVFQPLEGKWYVKRLDFVPLPEVVRAQPPLPNPPI